MPVARAHLVLLDRPQDLPQLRQPRRRTTYIRAHTLGTVRGDDAQQVLRYG